jgi:hypothetical protein
MYYILYFFLNNLALHVSGAISSVTDRAKAVPNQYLLQYNNTPNHKKPMAVSCSCAPDDGCK